ncbi:hypothetical protein TNIN_484581 [Trichonephila inaurata madagascariensis]|uniref:BTB domain-containing protein n=1 Tax=Trichonephila inaurata madagascariensis TaxID=2747483 RepID=A0A8X6YGC7_9ARAC|nr:hypothetical protein TNIN_459911 [Trichonephila inaurata madagascariensis]GFY71813.1 hypothetical protein TNIN_484581 [Trichonephila inaurata madagascariensis]
MSELRTIVRGNFKFTWEIKEFLEHIEKNSFDLETLQFNVKCSDITTWYAELVPGHTNNDCKVSLVLNRLSEDDELDTIFVNLKTTIENENGDILFQNDAFRKVTKDDCQIFFEDVIGSTNYLKTLPFFGTLFLHFNLDTLALRSDASNFNLNPAVQNLSMDLNNLYVNETLREATICVGNTLFFVHLFVLHARWPNFSEYLSKYPNLVSENDLQAVFKISFEILILAALTHNAGYTVHENQYREEIREVIEIFTPDMFDFILYYMYTGYDAVIEEDRKPNFIRLCRLFGFTRLAYKYNETPIGSACLTQAPLNHYTFYWSQEDGLNWENIDFEPFVQVIKSSRKWDMKMLELQFTIEDNDFIINVRYLEAKDPPSLSCTVILKDGDGFENQRFHYYNRFSRRGVIWPVRVGMTKEDIPFKSFTIDFTLHYSYASKITKNVYSLNSENIPESPALHQYRCDFWELYASKRIFDTVLIAEGKVFYAHRYILCARSAKFHKELREKLRRPHQIVHMVHGIKYHILERMLEYIYTGEVDEDEIDNKEDFLEAATRYNLRHLLK